MEEQDKLMGDSPYQDVAAAARGAIEAAIDGRASELILLFECVERLFVEGDQAVQNLMGAGFIEGLQNHAVYRALEDPQFDPDMFLSRLGPASMICWREMLTAFKDNPQSLKVVVEMLQTQRDPQSVTRLESQERRRKARRSPDRKV